MKSEIWIEKKIRTHYFFSGLLWGGKKKSTCPGKESRGLDSNRVTGELRGRVVTVAGGVSGDMNRATGGVSGDMNCTTGEHRKH